MGFIAGQTVHFPVALAQGDSQTFRETGHTIHGRFLEYWRANGGLAQQGYPLTEEFQEVNDLDGKTYTVQYFERAVFEHHPENQRPYDVLLSQLGTFKLKERYPQGPPVGGQPPVGTTPQPAGTPTSEPNGEQPVVLKGSGIMNTPPFHLNGGNYTVTWIASDRTRGDQVGCFHGGYIKSVQNGVFENIGSGNVSPDSTSQGSTTLYNLKPGEYYLDISSGCDWTVTIAPLR